MLNCSYYLKIMIKFVPAVAVTQILWLNFFNES